MPVLVTKPWALAICSSSSDRRYLACGRTCLIEARDRLDVVIQDVGLLVQHFLQCIPVAAEVGDKDFDTGAGGLQANLTDRLGPDSRAAVGKLVAIDAGDDRVLQPHRRDGFSDAHRLVQIQRRRSSRRDVAEAARAGADVAQDHQCRRPGGPALAHVGASRRLADGVEPLVVHQVQELQISPPAGIFILSHDGFRPVQRRGDLVLQHQMIEGNSHSRATLSRAPDLRDWGRFVQCGCDPLSVARIAVSVSNKPTYFFIRKGHLGTLPGGQQ